MKTDGPIIILCWCQVKSVFGEDKVASKGLMEWEIRYCPHCGKNLKIKANLPWINVKDKLPPTKTEVLLYYQGSEDIGTSGWKGYAIGFINSKRGTPVCWVTNAGFAQPEIATPTHWRLFPDPPMSKPLTAKIIQKIQKEMNCRRIPGPYYQVMPDGTEVKNDPMVPDV